VIRRRHVLYVEGYDPQGAEGYHAIFQRQWRRFLKIWPLHGRVSDLVIDNDDLAHWTIEAAGPNWQVSTRYEFLRQEQMIRANMAEPLWRIVPRAVGWMFDYHLSGTMIRIARASHQYALALLFFQIMLLVWIALGVVAGWGVASLAFRFTGVPELAAIALGVVAGIGVFVLLKPVAGYFFTIQINSHWPYMLEYARGMPSCFDRAIEAGARRLVDIVRANDADEVLLIGHSGGGKTAPAVMARALELDPELGRRGPRVVLLTLGSILPGAALHPRATKLHAIVKRLAAEPSIRWIDAQSRKDVLNFWEFDAVEGLGLTLDGPRHNPTIWRVRFRDMLAPEFYNRLRTNFFRMHYQFIMANDSRAYYDYFMLVAGPAPAEQWVGEGWEMVKRFGEEMSYSA
jgi:hypothetical protein